MLPDFVKLQPKYQKYIPWLRRHLGSTFNKTIYLREDIYQDLKSKHPSPESRAVLAHEMVHCQRSRKMNLLEFGLKYIFSGKFRFNEELEANKAAFKILKKEGVKVDLKRRAKILSSWLYLWPVSYNYALTQIKEAWEEV